MPAKSNPLSLTSFNLSLKASGKLSPKEPAAASARILSLASKDSSSVAVLFRSFSLLFTSSKAATVSSYAVV